MLSYYRLVIVYLNKYEFDLDVLWIGSVRSQIYFISWCVFIWTNKFNYSPFAYAFKRQLIILSISLVCIESYVNNLQLWILLNFYLAERILHLWLINVFSLEQEFRVKLHRISECNKSQWLRFMIYINNDSSNNNNYQTKWFENVV